MRSLTAGSTLAFTQLGAHTSTILISAALVVSGLGLGAALVPSMTGAYRGLARAAIPRATSSVRIFQQLGGTFGIAILAVVLQQQITDNAAPGQATTGSLAAAYGHTFWWALAFTALALLPALLLPGTPANEDAANPDDATWDSSAA